ncbi:MAG TPA: hypothetical protein DEO60_07330 [Bacteroidales bacterium]|jgi:hypothetical protein|nr:hypothetical protein [Bacteroidales bacterium]HBZ20921.1 hypothetical protein [Bacteroidales bacterium]
MIRKIFFLLILTIIAVHICLAQNRNSTADLMSRRNAGLNTGELKIYQDPGIDSLIGRYILYNRKLNGLEGFRIQIYNSSNKNAREESGKVRAEFISKFPDIVSYASFDKPSYYKIRAGNYRSRIEGTRYLLMIRKVFPDAILVPAIINFPDKNTN